MGLRNQTLPPACVENCPLAELRVVGHICFSFGNDKNYLSDAGGRAAMGVNTEGLEEAPLGRNRAKMLGNASESFPLPIGLCRLSDQGEFNYMVVIL